MKLTIKTAADLQAKAIERHKASITSAVDEHVEAQARALQYNSAAHLAGYRDSTVPQWRDEAQAFIAWRDQVWLDVLALLTQAEETGEVPTVESVIGALPEWSAP